MAIKVTEDMYKESKAYEYKTHQPFLESRLTPEYRRTIFFEPDIKKCLVGRIVPLYDSEVIAMSALEKINPIGMCKIGKKLELTIKFLDKKWERIYKGVRGRKKFDQFLNVGFYGRTQLKDNDNGTQTRTFNIEYFKLAPNLTIEVVPNNKLFDILSNELEATFPKGECKERGQAIVLIAQVYIKISEELKVQYGKDKYMKKFLERSGDIDVEPDPSNL